MPIEIVGSNPQPGEILQTDLLKMKNDFIQQAILQPDNGRTTLFKKYSVAVNVEEFKKLIAYYEDPSRGIEVININFAIHLNPAPNLCSLFNYSDSLTVVVEAAKFDVPGNSHSGYTSYESLNDYVVIPAFPTPTVPKHLWSSTSPCCPSGKP